MVISLLDPERIWIKIRFIDMSSYNVLLMCSSLFQTLYSNTHFAPALKHKIKIH